MVESDRLIVDTDGGTILVESDRAIVDTDGAVVAGIGHGLVVLVINAHSAIVDFDFTGSGIGSHGAVFVVANDSTAVGVNGVVIAAAGYYLPILFFADGAVVSLNLATITIGFHGAAGVVVIYRAGIIGHKAVVVHHDAFGFVVHNGGTSMVVLHGVFAVAGATIIDNRAVIFFDTYW